MHPFRSLVLAAAVAAQAGCVATTSVVSNRAPDAITSPKRIYMVSNIPNGVGLQFGPSFEKGVESRFLAHLRQCGVESTGYAVAPLDLGNPRSLVEAFRPDAILVADTTNLFFAEYGAVVSATIRFRLQEGTDETTSKVVWHAAAVFRPAYRAVIPGSRSIPPDLFTRPAEDFADAVVAQMKADGFFPGCPTTPLASSAAPVLAASYVAGTSTRAAGGLTLGKLVDLRKPDPEPKDNEYKCALGSDTTCPGKDETAYLRRLNGPTVVVFSPDISQYVTAALGAELKRMGLETTEAHRTLEGEIVEARTDISRWGYGCHVRVRFTLKDAGTGKVLHTSEKTASAPIGQIATEGEAFNLALRGLAESLAADPEFAAAVR